MTQRGRCAASSKALSKVKRSPANHRPPRRTRGTVHVEREASIDGSGHMRFQERVTVRVEDADGTVTAVEQVTVEDRTEDCPFVSTGTRRTRTRRTKRVP